MSLKQNFIWSCPTPEPNMWGEIKKIKIRAEKPVTTKQGLANLFQKLILTVCLKRQVSFFGLDLDFWFRF